MTKSKFKKKELDQWNEIKDLIQKNKDEWEKFKKDPSAIGKKDWNRISSLTIKTRKKWDAYKNKK